MNMLVRRYKETRLDQSGINMVDLMMWLVIAALLLAAALQSIGYYQKAALVSRAKNDVALMRTNITAVQSGSGAMSSLTADEINDLRTTKLSGANYFNNIGEKPNGVWCAEVVSPDLYNMGGQRSFVFSNENTNIISSYGAPDSEAACNIFDGFTHVAYQ